jgi:uncharacterized glyoxalase superfamily protein PhnB
MKVNKVTPILVVDAIEPCLAFWTGPMGYTKTVEVPHEDRLGFVLLVKDGAGELMMQTRASVQADLALEPIPACMLYLDVPSLEAALAATTGTTIVVAPRKTFYGAREAFLRDRAGNVFGFAEHDEHS